MWEDQLVWKIYLVCELTGPQYGEYGSCLYDMDGRENILYWYISLMFVNQNKCRYEHNLCLCSYQSVVVVVAVVLEEIKVVNRYLPTHRISSESLVNQFWEDQIFTCAYVSIWNDLSQHVKHIILMLQTHKQESRVQKIKFSTWTSWAIIFNRMLPERNDCNLWTWLAVLSVRSMFNVVTFWTGFGVTLLIYTWVCNALASKYG